MSGATAEKSIFLGSTALILGVFSGSWTSVCSAVKGLSAGQTQSPGTKKAKLTTETAPCIVMCGL